MAIFNGPSGNQTWRVCNVGWVKPTRKHISTVRNAWVSPTLRLLHLKNPLENKGFGSHLFILGREKKIMGILTDIQSDLVDGSSAIGPALLKLRLLAAKLGSDELAEWVKFESEGYPMNVNVPDYRKLGVSFSGTFFGPFGARIENAPIPSVIIGKIAGDDWTSVKMRESAAAVDAIVSEGSGLHLDYSNLSLLIQGKVYENYACNQMKGYVSHPAIVEVSNAVRNRALEVTIGLEEAIPNSANIDLAGFKKAPEVASEVVNNTIYNGSSVVHNNGDHAKITVSVQKGNRGDLREQLTNAGFNDEHAKNLAEVISNDKPESNSNYGAKTAAWLGDKLSKSVDLGIKGGIPAAIGVAKEAALQFWELK
jgi:hypothetical protein